MSAGHWEEEGPLLVRLAQWMRRVYTLERAAAWLRQRMESLERRC
ncbi:unnamed protein product [Ectocarpus sp. 6 AP-2014]